MFQLNLRHFFEIRLIQPNLGTATYRNDRGVLIGVQPKWRGLPKGKMTPHGLEEQYSDITGDSAATEILQHGRALKEQLQFLWNMEDN
jgi:hypothetical protein